MCRIESHKDMKCVSFAVNVCICEMLFLTCTEHTSIMSPELMKLRIMIISIKTKIVVKFGTSEMRCVELRAKNLYEICTVCSKCICIYMTGFEKTLCMGSARYSHNVRF